MIIDIDQLPSSDLLADVCIIGAGAAGVTLALDLIGSGLKVVLVESGGFSVEPETQALYQGENVGQPMEMDVGRYRVFGGSTSRWTGRCAPLDPIDFEQRDWIPHSGWPITFDDVKPYYARAQTICGFSQSWTSDEDGSAGTTVNGHAAAPFHWRFPPRTGLGAIHFGRLYRKQLRADPNTTVVTHANIVGMQRGDSAAVSAIKATALSGRQITVTAAAHVLCCGGIENARLLLNTAAVVPGGLGNGHDLVGRFFMQHPRGATATITASRSQSRRLQKSFNTRFAGRRLRQETGFSLPTNVQRNRRLLNASAVLNYTADADSGWAASMRITEALRAGKLSRSLGKDIQGCLRRPTEIAANLWRQRVTGHSTVLLDPLIRIVVDLEQQPDPNSRVSLSPAKDRFGLHQATVNWRIGDLERQTARMLTELISTDIAADGLGDAQLAPWLFETAPVTERELVRTHHHIGTTRMAADASRGVVDANCRVFGTTNMFVAGSSVFPTGGHVNPTLTIVALALRLSAHLKRTLTQAGAIISREAATLPH